MNEPFTKRRTRIGVLTAVLGALFLIVAMRLVALVLLDGPRLASMAHSEHTGEIELTATRGPIVDRNGEPLALSAETRSVYARPAQLLANSTAADRARLADALGISRGDLEQRLNRPQPFIWLARHIAAARAQSAEALGLDGVGSLNEYKRFYPEGALAAPVVGMAGMDGQGLSGIELQYDRLIRGEPVALRFYHDALGHPILDSPLALKAAEPGGRVELTIDAGIQSLAERQLAGEVQQSGAARGAAVVLDPFTGEVLALANAASGDSTAAERLHDTAVQDAFEPGSTMKGLLGSIALSDGVIRPDQQIYCENGEFVVDGRKIHDDSRHGSLDLGGIIEVSSNIGAAKIALRLGAARFYQGLRSFGLGMRTGVDLPGEAPGLLRPYHAWRNIDLANHGFGQGIAVTPMQLAVAYAAIANGGVIMRPYVVKAIYDAEGHPILTHTPQALRRAISPSIAHAMNRLLQGVVNGPEGTGRLARVGDFIVAGKTGTAQMVNPSTGAYYQSRLVASFVGFVPAEDPRLVILVVLYDVGHGHFGGMVAAPVFSQIAAGALSRLDVAANGTGAGGGTSGVETTEASMIPSAGPEAANGTDADAAIPHAEAESAAAVSVGTAPDFRGLSLRQALARARASAVEVTIAGDGYVVGQTPAAGAALDGTAVRLTLAPVLADAAGESVSPMASEASRIRSGAP